MPPKKAAAVVSDAPEARLLDKEPSDIHKADADWINAAVGKAVVTARQVMFCKVLLMKAQAARRVDNGAAAPAKPATAAKAPSKAPAKRGRPAKATAARGGRRGAQAAASQTASAATEATGDAPF